MYKANDKIDGEKFNVEDDVKDKRPFKALLDVGINRTTTGARIFGALKGASDGGLNIPHKIKRFAGYKKAKLNVTTNKRGKAVDAEKIEASFSAKEHRDRIFGVHVTNYMNLLKKENPTKFKKQFSQWDKCLTDAKAKTCEDIYKKVHAGIIANPDRVKAKGNAKPTKTLVKTEGSNKVLKDSKGRQWIARRRLTTPMRKERVTEKIAAAVSSSKK